ncbi:MAG: extracellular solute-binding protein, partial [Phycisphaerae bacterium]|nr:extracellular solute-binding protein [Phycisphaerae bacterium]MDW8263590.1 extracellular solute-binding protein [Phycisphaerales bacterium]
WDRHLLASRLAPYSRDGVIFGVPHDVHPCGIAYRADLFAEAGVDLEQAQTWEEFHELCLRAQEVWRARGAGDRWAMELSQVGTEWILVMMMQRGINPIDPQLNVHLNDPRVAQIVARYARMCAGPKRIGVPPAPGQQGFRDLSEGRLAAFFCPDFRPAYLKKYAPRLEGKLRLRSLPKFDPSDAPTGTWGGTMFGIPRNCRQPREAFRLLETLLLSDAAIAARLRHSTVLPPDTRRWDEPAYLQGDAFFGGQQVMKLYADLARQLPVRYVTPFTPMASTELSDVLARAIDAVESGRDTDLEALCQGWLAKRAADLKRRIEFGRFD